MEGDYAGQVRIKSEPRDPICATRRAETSILPFSRLTPSKHTTLAKGLDQVQVQVTGELVFAAHRISRRGVRERLKPAVLKTSRKKSARMFSIAYKGTGRDNWGNSGGVRYEIGQ